MKTMRLAVMGCAGTGKSTFVQKVTGDPVIKIGTTLDSCTTEVKAYSYKVDGIQIDLVDTPGFDDSRRNEIEIFVEIAGYLFRIPEADSKLHGVVYLHPAFKNRMEGTSMRNLDLLKAMCGEGFYSRVILALSIWDKEPLATAQSRLHELQQSGSFWAEMINKGSTCCMLPTAKPQIAAMLMQLAKLEPRLLQLQNELNSGTSVNSTLAAQAVISAIGAREITEGGEHRLQDERSRREKLLADAKKEEASNLAILQKQIERTSSRVEAMEFLA